MQLTAREHRLEHIAGVHRPFRLAGANDRVKLVDEENDSPLRFLNLLENCLQPLLKLSPILRASDERPHIEREDSLILEPLRHIATHYSLRKPLNNRGFSNTRLTDENGIVLRLSGEDANNSADLAISTDHRVKLSLTRLLNEITPIPLKRLIRRFRVRAHDPLISSNNIESREEAVSCQVKRGADLSKRALRIHIKSGEHKVLHGDVLIF